MAEANITVDVLNLDATIRMKTSLSNLIDAASNYVKPRRTTDARQVLLEKLDEARTALAQRADEPVAMLPMVFEDGRRGWYVDHPDFYCDIEPDATTGAWSAFFRDKHGAEAFAERTPAAPAPQRADEPVAWRKPCVGGHYLRSTPAMADIPEADDGLSRHGWEPLYTAAPAAPHPAAWLGGNGHPQHISAVQTATDKRLYGPWKPLYTAAPAAPAQQQQDKWRDTVDDMLTVLHAVASDDPRESIDRLINWNVSVALDPCVSSDAQALIERGRMSAPAAPAYVPLSDEDLEEVVLQEEFLLVCDGMDEFKEIARHIESLVVARMRGEGE